MKRSNIWFASILIASALLLSGVRSASAAPLKPMPRTTPQAERETTSETKPASNNSQQAEPNSPSSYAFPSPTPRGSTQDANASNSQHTPAEEERHDRQEEALESKLVCLTAILAAIEVATAIIYFVTMLASIRAANAAKDSAHAAYENAEIAKQSFETMLRGIVEIEPVGIYFTQTTPTVYFVVINSGHRQVGIEEQRFKVTYKPKGDSHPLEFAAGLGDRQFQPIPHAFDAGTRVSDKIAGSNLDGIFAGIGGRSMWQVYCEGELLVCFWAYVRYIDHLGESHETYACIATDNSKKFAIQPDMPSSYNRRT